MRILSAALIWIMFIGGLMIFITFRDTTVAPPPTSIEIKEARASYTLAVTTTFALVPDPFAIQTDDETKPPALLVRLGNKEILRKTDLLAAGRTIRVEPLLGLVLGDNEIYFQASPPIEEADKHHAIRLQILLKNQIIAEKTFWSSSGGNLSGTFRFTLTPLQDTKENHDHH